MALLAKFTVSQLAVAGVFLFIVLGVATAAPHHDYCNTVEIPINNYLLYQLGISPGNVIDEVNVQSVLLKTFGKHKVDVNKVEFSSVVCTVVQKLKNMLYRSRKCKGGYSRNKLMQNWKKSNYIIKVRYKTDSPTKRKLKADTERERKKRKRSAEKVKAVKHKVEVLLSEKRELERQIDILHNGKSKQARRGKAKNKLVYSKSFRRKMEVRRMNSIKKSVQELSRGYFTPISLSVRDRFGHTVAIEIEQPKDQSRKNNFEQLIDKLIYIRDTQNISRRAYHELTMHCPTLPKDYRLSIRKQEINSQYEIHDLEKYIGVWQSFRETLSCRLSVLLSEAHMRDVILHDGVAKVKITGDGTTIGKRIHITNIAFSIIGEPSCAGSRGSYLLAIVRIPEKQAPLADALGSLISEINGIDSVSVGEESVKVQLYLAGDLKFLNQMVGVEGFSAKHCCLWCICPSELRWDCQKVWCMYDVERGARTVENITKNSSKKGKDRLNCFAPPLFPSIPVSHVVPDTLHLFLRISDQLVNHLLVELKALDNLRKCTSSFVITKYTHVQKFESFVQALGIPWQFYLDKSSKLITSRDFTGPEHLKIFQNIQLVDFIPNHSKLRKIEKLWKDFLLLMNSLKNTLTLPEVDQFEMHARAWVKLFTEVYLSTDVTPYMHVLINHIPDALRLHGNISYFSQQGLEKLNDNVTAWFFRSSSHIKTDAFRQVIQKQNRIHHLAISCQRENASAFCSICKNSGHNKRTCPMKLTDLSERQ